MGSAASTASSATTAPPATPALPALPPVLAGLPALVVKDGVGLGGLAAEAQALALAVVWATLPGGPMTERQVNDALKAALAAPAVFLDTDHVELRRWLVDAGWLTRDGFGREYRRVAAAAVAAPWRDLAAALRGLDVAECVQRWRAEKAAQRAARRQAFAGGSGGAGGSAGAAQGSVPARP
jgi:hypothetical protein